MDYCLRKLAKEKVTKTSEKLIQLLDFPDSSVVKNLPASAGDKGDVGSLPGLRRSLGGGNGNPLHILFFFFKDGYNFFIF